MSSSDIIQRTGQLLLDGWKLLSISCPICNTALLSSRSGEMKCPGCNLPVMMERNDVKFPQEPKLDKEPSPNQSNSNKHSGTYNLDNVSSRIGEKLLKGWVMTSESCTNSDCRGTPLMRDPASGSKLCMCCDNDYSRPANNIDTEVTESMDEESFSIDDDSVVLGLQKIIPSQNDPSKLISEKLLKGWGLLSTCCSSAICNGNTPLMRNLDGKTCCVACGWVAENHPAPIAPANVSAAVLSECHSSTNEDNSHKKMALNVVKKKLNDAVTDLETSDVHHSIQLAELICKLGNAVNILKGLEENDFKI